MREQMERRGRRTAAEYRHLVREHRRSGLSARAFAEAHGINPATFGWWRSELRRRSRASSGPGQELIPVQVLESAPVPTTAGFEVRLATGDAVFVPTHFDELSLARLLAALRR